MNIYSFLLRIVSVLGIIALVGMVYFFVARPYQLRWGATDEEIRRAMPGDELDPNPTFLATRSITIHGTPEEIWPWLIQMGYGRAGFYGYDILENIGSPRGIDSATEILPEFQHFKVGDVLPISSVARNIFYAIQPNQYLVWSGETGPNPGGFTWALYPIDSQHTRLISRIRWTHHSITQPGLFALDVFTDLADHIAVRKVLEGVKGRVEGTSEPSWVTNAQFFTYVLAFLIFCAACLLVLMRSLSWTRWTAGLVTGLGWLLIWYSPVPFWVGSLLDGLMILGLFLIFK